MGKVWFVISNFLLALLVLIIAFTASAAMVLVMYLIGLMLILLGCSAFANSGEFNLGTLLGAALFVVPGVLLMKFAKHIVEGSDGFMLLFMGIFVIIFAIIRFAKCAREADDLYIEGFASTCSVLYPLCMLLAGIGFILSFVFSEGWAVVAMLLMAASSILWMIRTVIIVRDN